MFVRVFAVLTIATLVLSIMPAQSYATTTETPVLEAVETPVLGCMDSEASNFNASATEDDGSCETAEEESTYFSDFTDFLDFGELEDNHGSRTQYCGWEGSGQVYWACDDDEEAPQEEIYIVAHKIVCDSETDLPNWGGAASENIDQSVIDAWLDAHPNCKPEAGWYFQWEDEDAPDEGDDFIGESDNYTTFYMPTDANGEVTVTIPLYEWFSEIHLREVLKDGYIPFGHSAGTSTSAEFYCDGDVVNYDNYDFIRNPHDKAGQTIHCVAFNVMEETPVVDVCPNIDGDQATVPEGYEMNNDYQCVPVVARVCEAGSNLLQNASFETPIPAAHGGDWEIFTAVPNWTISSTGLEIWAQDFFGGPSEGAQNAELDGNESTEISQIVTTIVGATYKLGFDFSARPNTNLANNNIDANANGVTVVNASGDGSSSTSTAWTSHSSTFVATTTSTIISFKDKGVSDSFGSLIDNTKLCFVSNGNNGGGGNNNGTSTATSTKMYRIEGNVWHDANSDDTKNEGEVNLPGWTVSITNGATTTSTTSDTLGNYAFVAIPPGTWTITEVLLSGWSQTFPNSGSHILVLSTASTSSTTVTGNDFGNVMISTTTDNGGGGGSSSSGGSSGTKRTSSGGNGNGNGDGDGEVLGDSTIGEVKGAEAPVGAPNAGIGGMSDDKTLPIALAILGILASVVVFRATRRSKSL